MRKERNEKLVSDISNLISQYEKDTECMVDSICISEGLVNFTYFDNSNKRTFTAKFETMQREGVKKELEYAKEKIGLILTSFYNKTGIWIRSMTTVLHSNPRQYDINHPDFYITVDETKISVK